MGLDLDKNTYGKSPAALYLTLYLNEKDDSALNRKVGRKLSKWRQVIHDVSMSHMHTDEMMPCTFATLLSVLDVSIREDCLKLTDKLCQELVTNILIGEIKTWKIRAQKRTSLQVKAQRSTPNGESVPIIRIMPRSDEETDDERIIRLQKKSAEYLARKGKKNTLY